MGVFGKLYMGELMAKAKLDPSVFKRVYKVKDAVVEFLCPLCSAPRGLRYRSKLTQKNYVHIIMINLVLGLLLFNLMSFKVIYLFFLVWAAYEAVHKMLYRKEIPCPHCGFDATWYKRDVKIARKLVHEFWDARAQEVEGSQEKENAKEKGEELELDVENLGRFEEI